MPIDIINAAARAAYDAGIRADDEAELIAWIGEHCRYRPDQEFFLVLLIGAELADIDARATGFKSQVDRIMTGIMDRRRAVR